MDQTLKRVLILTFVVVIVAKLSSAMYDGFMDDTQEEMMETQQAFSEHGRAENASQVQARAKAARAKRCLNVMQTEKCTHPKKYRTVGECLRAMKMAGCRDNPRVNLCAVVEELERCADPFADPKRSGCRDLRRIAECKAIPAPDDRSDLWLIEMDDGMWRGDE